MKRTMQDPDVKGLFDNIAERNERNTKAVEELEREYEGIDFISACYLKACKGDRKSLKKTD